MPIDAILSVKNARALVSMDFKYRIVASTNTCHYSKNQVFMGVTKDRREGWTDARSAVGFCLGSGLFGSYNSD